MKFISGWLNINRRRNRLDEIEINKQISRIKKEANQYTKGTNCALCGKSCTSFCNSHTIPRFVIKNIAQNGKVYYPSMTMDNIDLKTKLNVFKANPGVEETLTFDSICRECDNAVFSCVESEEVLENEFDAKVLNLYALKVLLHAQYSKIRNANFLNVGAEKHQMSDIANIISMPWVFDMIESTREIEDYKSAMKNNTYIKHKIIIDKIIDKKTDFCCTTELTLPFSYKGKRINNLCDIDNYAKRFGGIYTLVLPMNNNKTRIVMYYRRKYSSFDTVKEEFSNMNLEEQLQAISNLLLIYTEEFVYNDNILPNIKLANEIIADEIVNDPNVNNYLRKIEWLNNKKINMFNL